MANNYDPEACVDDDEFYDDLHDVKNKEYLHEDQTLIYVFVSIIVLTTFVIVVNDQDDIKNLRDFCLSNL